MPVSPAPAPAAAPAPTASVAPPFRRLVVFVPYPAAATPA
jgi:hypothetical protein